MSLLAAAVVPSPPLLVRELAGRSVVLPELREACAVAVARLLRAAPDVVVVAGAGPQTRSWEPDARLNVAAWGPLARTAGTGTPGLPLALGIGASLLDDAGYGGPRVLQAVAADATPEECLALGAAAAGHAARVALLAVGDGSARRTPAAPGHFDPRAEGFDASAEKFLRAGDMTGLASLDPVLASDLLATGRAAWQVLAGAAGGQVAPADVLYCDIPFGVSYLVAELDLPAPSPPQEASRDQQAAAPRPQDRHDPRGT